MRENMTGAMAEFVLEYSYFRYGIFYIFTVNYFSNPLCVNKPFPRLLYNRRQGNPQIPHPYHPRTPLYHPRTPRALYLPPLLITCR